MKRFAIVFLILFLILSTAIIKNSTKRFEDEIFVIQENIQILEKEYENIKLEFDYLSSAEKLLDLKNLYFDDSLIKKDIQEIKVINLIQDNIEIGELKFINEK
tara:strand:+ start:174 stop:482 length:309 start_codon:yes stop_codon:yes gene_type:complete